MPSPIRSPYILVRNSSIHSRGVFAKTDIPKGTRVIEYVGEKITKAESNRRCDAAMEQHKKNRSKGAIYVFELNKRHDIDGSFAYNTARLINHSCDPNCETEIIRGKIWIISTRKIKKGEEISYDYGCDVDEWQDHPCLCLSKRCVGYIVAQEQWPKLKRVLEKEKLKKKRKRR